MKSCWSLTINLSQDYISFKNVSLLRKYHCHSIPNLSYFCQLKRALICNETREHYIHEAWPFYNRRTIQCNFNAISAVLTRYQVLMIYLKNNVTSLPILRLIKSFIECLSSLYRMDLVGIFDNAHYNTLYTQYR